MAMQHVILGNGPAGVIAAETLRKLKPADAITLVGDEAAPPYSRMAIPYLLEGDIGESGTYLRDDGAHFERLGIKLVRDLANGVDAAAKKVTLANGGTLAYDRLLLATGSKPIRPPVPGINRTEILSCWTLEDARAIMAASKPGSRILQMGAGFIGCIIMEALAAKGKLTVVEMEDRIVPRMMTPQASLMIQRWCNLKGVEILTSTRVAAIETPAKPSFFASLMRGFASSASANGSAQPLLVRFADGTVREFDMIVCATGVQPKVDYLQGSGIKIGAMGGIAVDDSMRTSVPDIFAAGDCTESVDFSTGEPFVNAIQPDAADQSLIAAMNMAGRPAKSRGALRMNVLDTFGLVSSSFGQWWGAEGGEHAEVVDARGFKYLRLEFSGDYVVGATSVGLTEHVGVLRGMIQTRAKLSPRWKAKLMQDPHKFVAAYLASAQGAA